MRNHGSHSLVLIVDDDACVRAALQELLQSVGIESTGFASAQEMAESRIPARPGCLILDVRMPGLGGLDLQHRLAADRDAKPIVFLTGHADVPMAVQAMKAGAVDFLIKPVRDQEFLDAVASAIARDIARRESAAIVARNIRRVETLTPREREVLNEVAHGRLNKQIAFDLGISEVTVKLHRGNGMRKMEAASIGELIRAWETLPASMREPRRFVARHCPVVAQKPARDQNLHQIVDTAGGAGRTRALNQALG